MLETPLYPSRIDRINPYEVVNYINTLRTIFCEGEMLETPLYPSRIDRIKLVRVTPMLISYSLIHITNYHQGFQTQTS